MSAAKPGSGQNRRDLPAEAKAEQKFDPGRRNDTGRKIDTKELLKKEMFGSANAADDDHFEKSRPSPNGVVNTSDHYLFLDSFEKLEESDLKSGTFKWNFMVQGVTGDQVIGTRDKIENIVSVRISEFTMGNLPKNPYVLNATDSALPVLVPNVAPPPYNPTSFGPLAQVSTSTGRFAIVLKELGRQAVPTKAGREHFDLMGSIVPAASIFIFTQQLTERTFLYPVPGNDSYIFTDPIKDIHGLTLQFLNPDIPLNMPNDCFYEVIMRVDPDPLGSGQLEFEVPGQDLTDLNDPLGLGYNDTLFIIGGVATTDDVLNRYLNSPRGRLMGNPLFNTATTFFLNPSVDVTAFGPAGTVIQSRTRVTVCVPKRRIRIPIVFQGVVGRLTNYRPP